MKKTCILLYLFCSASAVFAQVGSSQWTWMQGDDFIPQHPVYGSKGIAAPANKPGARKGAVSWMDASGRLWQFGGSGYAGTGLTYLNDLWMYEPLTGQWAWVSGDSSINQAGVYGTRGTAAPAGKPGARTGALGWTDAAGNLWLFGGRMYNAGNDFYFNDLWKYTLSTGLWTWVAGDNTRNTTGNYGNKGAAAPAGKPGGREGSVSWTDASGSQWLFGGFGYGNSTLGSMNDLWKYTPATGQWTWVSGDSSINQAGIYGTRGTAASVDKPGARQGAVGWADTYGNLWLFGGPGQGGSTQGYLNDLWKYDPSSGQWTWISGDSTGNQQSVYGGLGIAAAGNKPGGRNSAAGWTDASGNLLLLGGSGYAKDHFGDLNDLWKFTPSTGQWTWISGDSTPGKIAVYGTKGISAATNDPGGRDDAAACTDAAGNLWLLGGLGYAPGNGNSYAGVINDLWRYTPSTGQWTWISGDNIYGQIGVYGTWGTASPASKPGARQDAASWKDAAGNLWLFGGNGYNAGGTSNLNDLWKYTPASGQWTWINGDSTGNQTGVYGTLGVAAPANKPGARSGAVSWKNASGNFWLYGGVMGDYANDLWKYDPAAGQWTWMSGAKTTGQIPVYGTKGTADPANVPGARVGAVGWTDASSNLWLFGGFCVVNTTPRLTINSTYNDLWKYDISTGLWTWMGGYGGYNGAAVYGTRGTAAPANTPGGRQFAAASTDASGNMWLFGGYGYSYHLNDLWKYTPSSGQWTWAGGDTTGAQKGIYGSKGIAAPANKPGARTSAVCWADTTGQLWLFGGSGYPGNVLGNLNDLWKYTPATGQWTWMNGDSTANQAGIYGTRGMPDPANKPGGRRGAAGWTDAASNLWLLGGNGYSSSYTDYLNDLWKYTLPAAALPVRFGSFGARRQQQTVLLNWTTAQEQNSRCFIVERAAAGTLFDSIGAVAASGTASTATKYSFTDAAPLPGDNFYRLKELDLDGRYVYSRVEKIYIGEDAAGFTILQNPVQQFLQLQIRLSAARKLTLLVRDINGRLLFSDERPGSKGTAVYSLPVGHLAGGTYLITVHTESGNSTKTFLIQ